MKITRLFINDSPAARRRADNREVIVNGQLFDPAGLRVEREKIEVTLCVHLAGGGEKNRRAIRSEAGDFIRSRVPGQSLWNAARRRNNVHVRVSFIRSAERDPLAIGREMGKRFDSGMRRKPS